MKRRPAATLIELILYIMLFSALIGVLIPFFINVMQSYLEQKHLAALELSGNAIMQRVTNVIGGSEHILYPAQGSTSTVLVMQTGSEVPGPIELGTKDGALVMIQPRVRESLSAPQLIVENFSVTNHALSPFESVRISFTLWLHTQAPSHDYRRDFETTLALFPITNFWGKEHTCTAAPSCTEPNEFTWYYFNGICLETSFPFDCTP